MIEYHLNIKEVIDLKKWLSLFVVVVLICSLIVSTSAANRPYIYSENMNCDSGEVISIPIYIKNNPGIMGFKISVDYETEAFENPVVSRGTVTKSGSFNDSIKSTTSGRFDVLWSSTGDVYVDGTLFLVELKVKETALTDKYVIGISYSQADTFNENWQDVNLDCLDIEVVVGDYVESEEPAITFLDRIIAFFKYLFDIVTGWFI